MCTKGKQFMSKLSLLCKLEPKAKYNHAKTFQKPISPCSNMKLLIKHRLCFNVGKKSELAHTSSLLTKFFFTAHVQYRKRSFSVQTIKDFHFKRH